MSGPKYSIIIPTLNGARTLSVTLPEMLKLDRDDVEWVISNNHSDDDTEDVVARFGDARLRLVRPPERLPIGRHLEFAYLQASGTWLGHLGDDDHLLPSRFRILDGVIADTGAQVVRGEFVRYFWPDFPNSELANTIEAASFSGRTDVETGRDVAARWTNQRFVHGGGSWVVHRSIVEEARRRCGHFSSAQHLEFLAMRIACALAPTVALVGLPIWVLARHAKSAGSQAWRPKGESPVTDWDWSFEDPDPWRYCPFQYKGYTTLTLDAALTARACLPEILGDVRVNWPYWIDEVRADLERMIENRQLPAEARAVFPRGLRALSVRERWRWWLHRHRRTDRIVTALYRLIRCRKAPHREGKAEPEPAIAFGWPRPLRGRDVGVKGITDVPAWVEASYPDHFPD